MEVITMSASQFQFLFREFSKLDVSGTDPVQIIVASDGSVSITDCSDLLVSK